MTHNGLVGTWKLVSWENKSLEGEVTYPFGRDAIGYIMYADEGHMSVTVMRANRQNFAGGDLLGGSEGEKLAAIESYLAYCGTYEYDGTAVVHHVRASLYPNWVGMDQKRLVEVSEDTLELSTEPMLLRGKQQVARLVWKRV